MKADSVIMSEAMQALHRALTPVEVEKFVVMLNRDKFDYTRWRENLWQHETLESLSDKAQAYYQSRASDINRSKRR
jgi:hypothetical protein